MVAGHAEEPRRLRHALCMVSGGDGDDAARPRRRIERGKRVIGAAELEGAGALQAFGLQVDARGKPLRKERREEQRRADRLAGDALARGLTSAMVGAAVIAGPITEARAPGNSASLF